MRSKEDANDYRYFPDRDLLPVSISKKLIEEIKSNMPELPENKKERFMSQYGLSDYDTSILITDRELSEFFEKVLDKKGLQAASKGKGNAYINLVVKFHKLFGKIVKKLL